MIGVIPVGDPGGRCSPFAAAGHDVRGPPGNWAACRLTDHDRFAADEGGSPVECGKDLSFVPLQPSVVVEVRYDHMEGERFRHTAQFNRWRPDRDPRSYTYAQLERPVTFTLGAIVAGLASGNR